MAEVGARQVGEFRAPRGMLVRSVQNPMDKSTIVSIYPKAIAERKHTIEPGIFNLMPGSVDAPSLLTVGPSSWFRAGREETEPTLEIPVSSVAVAESVIRDYCNGMLACDMVDSMPGLFFVLGEVSIFEIKTKYTSKLKEAENKQLAWMKALVRIGDALWARASGNPMAISDEMRIAATTLGFNDKPWLSDFSIAKLSNCPACGSLKNPLYPVCPTCKAIDPSHAMAKEIKFAG